MILYFNHFLLWFRHNLKSIKLLVFLLSNFPYLSKSTSSNCINELKVLYRNNLNIYHYYIPLFSIRSSFFSLILQLPILFIFIINYLILYTLISKGNLVLSEYTELEGDFTEMARIVLKSIKPN